MFHLNLLSFRSPQPGHRVVLPETRQRVRAAERRTTSARVRGEVLQELRPQPREADQPEGVDQQRGKPPAEVEAPQGHRRIPQRPQASSRRPRKSALKIFDDDKQIFSLNFLIGFIQLFAQIYLKTISYSGFILTSTDLS